MEQILRKNKYVPELLAFQKLGAVFEMCIRDSGYTAALYAARAGLDTLVLEKLSAGGQMALTEEIDNYPGYEDGIDGLSLIHISGCRRR